MDDFTRGKVTQEIDISSMTRAPRNNKVSSHGHQHKPLTKRISMHAVDEPTKKLAKKKKNRTSLKRKESISEQKGFSNIHRTSMGLMP